MFHKGVYGSEGAPYLERDWRLSRWTEEARTALVVCMVKGRQSRDMLRRIELRELELREWGKGKIQGSVLKLDL
jgi:hypothetical protein